MGDMLCIGNRDLLLTNIGTADFFSVRHGTYPSEKKSYQVCIERANDELRQRVTRAN
jgi:hypothetical protein